MRRSPRGKTKARKKRKNSRKPQKRSWIIKSCLILGTSAITAAGILIMMVKWGAFGALPSEMTLKNIRNPEGSVILDRNNEEIGRYFLIDRRNITLGSLPKCVAQSLVATEDARFYTHQGVDYKSLMRVFFKTLLLQDRSAGGGSTLSQQLAKNLFPRQGQGFFHLVVSKIREILIAQNLESLHSKDDILELYLNTVPFGENVYGIEGAAQLFFGKGAAQLQWHEAATLIGMLKANTTYNPRLYPERALQRRNTVLALAKKQGSLPPAEHEAYRAKPLSLNYTKKSIQKTFAGYFKRQVLLKSQDILKEVNAKQGNDYDLYSSSLKIHTSLDASMQKMAESAVQEWMPVLQREFEEQWQDDALLRKGSTLLKKAIERSGFYGQFRQEGLSDTEIMAEMEQPIEMDVFTWKGRKTIKTTLTEQIRQQMMMLATGLVAIDPQSGEILAWVGGIDYPSFQYDHVSSRPGRQTGSVFKPIVYASALEKGISPCHYYKAEQKTYTTEAAGKAWTPGNAGASYQGKYSMEGALTESVNTVAVKVLEDTGIEAVIENAVNLGIKSNLPEVPSLALGTASIPLLEMASAYCAFPNGGQRTLPLIIKKIENEKGEVIWQQKEESKKQVFSKETALLMSHLLQNVVDKGTGKALRSTFRLKNDLAGKTGTTQDNVDGWFIGFTPRLVIGAWVGNDSPALHFKTTALGQGAHTALPIVGKFLQKINQNAKLKKYTLSTFEPLPQALEKATHCDPFREDFQLFQWLFGKKKGKKESKNEKGLFRKLFKKKK